MNIRIMTFNIQHGHHYIHHKIDLAANAAVIRDLQADICGLNEVRGLGQTPDYTAQAEVIAAELGFHGVFGCSIMIHGTEPYGNAVVSRFPAVKMEVIRIPDPLFDTLGDTSTQWRETRSILRCEYEIGGGFAVYQSHFGLTPIEREHAVTLAHQYLKNEHLPAVLMGDFNMTPDDPMMALLQKDFSSADKFLNGGKTFPSDAPKSKIDYIFANSKVEILSAQIPDVVVSDHRPVIAEISF